MTIKKNYKELLLETDDPIKGFIKFRDKLPRRKNKEILKVIKKRSNFIDC